jgi:hypothetical protein
MLYHGLKKYIFEEADEDVKLEESSRDRPWHIVGKTG